MDESPEMLFFHETKLKTHADLLKTIKKQQMQDLDTDSLSRWCQDKESGSSGKLCPTRAQKDTLRLTMKEFSSLLKTASMNKVQFWRCLCHMDYWATSCCEKHNRVSISRQISWMNAVLSLNSRRNSSWRQDWSTRDWTTIEWIRK